MSRINVLTKETPQSSLALATIHVTAHKQRKSASGKDAADWPYSRVCAFQQWSANPVRLEEWTCAQREAQASRVAERRLQKGALQKLCPRASCCAACGIRPEQRLNARPLRGQGRLEDLVRKRRRGPHLCRCFRTRVQWELWPCRTPSACEEAPPTWLHVLLWVSPDRTPGSLPQRVRPSGAVGVWGRELRPGLGWGRRCCGWRCALHPPPQAETTAPYRLSPGQHDLQEPRFQNQTNCLKTETEAQEVRLSTGILLSHEAAQNDASGRSTDGPRGWILREVSQREKQHKITMAGGT
uniref:Uncharacterized protein n=1 Tax=Rangifer tarandus platyrhynchus TaxID=3082113 RepID=A0ACB0F8T5_RANTA|nr:unnamed protein product [Rangifer tarandus platyrhynchus]